MGHVSDQHVAMLAAATAGTVAILAAALLRKLRKQEGSMQASKSAQDHPPCAVPWLPLLGNALGYKADPPGFLSRQRDILGPTFLLDLAGLQTTVVSRRHEITQVALASDTLLSSRAAVADFGFSETLGALNVYSGTELHRYVLRGVKMEGLSEAVAQAVDEAMPSRQGCLTDLFAAVRRMTLHAVIIHLISDAVLKTYNEGGEDFLSEFMSFQDGVEDATAKGVVMPAWFSRIFIWRRVRLERVRIASKLAIALGLNWSTEHLGHWLKAVRSLSSLKDVPSLRQTSHRGAGLSADATPCGPVSPAQAAELIIGLLFAAHKNPAIGAAQTLAFLLENPSCMKVVLEEANDDRRELTSAVKETLRLTAHTLGGIRKVVAPEGFELETLGGQKLHIPHGHYIGISHTLPNLDAEVFTKPINFQPQRFAGQPVWDDYEYTTFGQGRHLCPGRQYAFRLMELLLANVLNRFEIELLKPLPPISYERATLAQRCGPCSIRYTSKGASHTESA